MGRRIIGTMAVLTVCTLGIARAAAQTPPWELLFGTCDVVNTRTTQLVVSSSSRALESVDSGQPVPFSRVDNDGFVLINDVLQGFLSLQADANGLAAVWWLSLSGAVVELNPLTGEVRETLFLPGDISGSVCDACDIVDDPELCGCLDEAECGDDNPCTDDFCERGVCLNEDNADACDDGDPCTADDTCARGFCVGEPLDDCDPSHNGNANDNTSDGGTGDDGGGDGASGGSGGGLLSLCGLGTAAAIFWTFAGLIATRLARRRR